MVAHHRRNVNNPFANKSRRRTVGYSDNRYGNSHQNSQNHRWRKGSLFRPITCVILVVGCMVLFSAMPSSYYDDSLIQLQKLHDATDEKPKKGTSEDQSLQKTSKPVAKTDDTRGALPTPDDGNEEQDDQVWNDGVSEENVNLDDGTMVGNKNLTNITSATIASNDTLTKPFNISKTFNNSDISNVDKISGAADAESLVPTTNNDTFVEMSTLGDDTIQNVTTPIYSYTNTTNNTTSPFSVGNVSANGTALEEPSSTDTTIDVDEISASVNDTGTIPETTNTTSNSTDLDTSNNSTKNNTKSENATIATAAAIDAIESTNSTDLDTSNNSTSNTTTTAAIDAIESSNITDLDTSNNSTSNNSTNTTTAAIDAIESSNITDLDTSNNSTSNTTTTAAIDAIESSNSTYLDMPNNSTNTTTAAIDAIESSNNTDLDTLNNSTNTSMSVESTNATTESSGNGNLRA
jgi:hypothetical protein